MCNFLLNVFFGKGKMTWGPCNDEHGLMFLFLRGFLPRWREKTHRKRKAGPTVLFGGKAKRVGPNRCCLFPTHQIDSRSCDHWDRLCLFRCNFAAGTHTICLTTQYLLTFKKTLATVIDLKKMPACNFSFSNHNLRKPKCKRPRSKDENGLELV